jgi:hypothetical protein
MVAVTEEIGMEHGENSRAVRGVAIGRRTVRFPWLCAGAIALLIVIVLTACSSGSGANTTISAASTATIAASPVNSSAATTSSAPSGSSPAPTANSAANATPAGAASRAAGRGNGQGAVIGKITAINGATWTITTPTGSTLTVAITPQTVFGTANAPVPQSQFAVGSNVVVRGPQTGTTVNATQVSMQPNAIIGKITAINDTTWTVTPQNGAALTVTITPQTTFGTAQAPMPQSQFTVGSMVVVRGQQTGTTVIATQISVPQAGRGQGTARAATLTPGA